MNRGLHPDSPTAELNAIPKGENFQLGGRSEFSQFYNEADLLEDASVPLSSHDSTAATEENSISNADHAQATPSLKDLKKKAFLKRSKTFGLVIFLIVVLVGGFAFYFVTAWKSHLNKKIGVLPRTVHVVGDNNSVGSASNQKDSTHLLGVESEKDNPTPAAAGPNQPAGQPAPLAKTASGPGAIGAQPGPGQSIATPQPALDAYGRPIAPELPLNRFDAPMGAQDGRASPANGDATHANTSVVPTNATSSGVNLASSVPNVTNTGATSNTSTGGSYGGNLTSAQTPRATASMIGNRSLILAQGVDIRCVLDTAVASDLPSMPRCHTPKDIYSDDGKVVLAEAGTTFNGESGAIAMKNGQSRLYVLWSRLKTPTGVTVKLDSPGADALGRGGLEGDLDKRWGERIGSAFLLSMVQDSIAYASTRGGNSTSPTVFQNTTNAGNQMATEVLKDSISIPPRLTLNQGEIITIHVARDVDFSSVYQLKAK